jgi:hypothetical protein
MLDQYNTHQESLKEGHKVIVCDEEYRHIEE